MFTKCNSFAQYTEKLRLIVFVNSHQMTDTIIPREHYMTLFYVSWTTCISILYALYQCHYYLSIVPIGVLLFSLNYWRKPDYSWRRYVDIVWAVGSFVFQIREAYKMSGFGKNYLWFVPIGSICFLMGVYYHKKNNREYQWLSTFFHSMVHIIGNVFNLVLYSENIC